MLRLPALIQQETRLVRLAEAMAEGAHLPMESEPSGTGSDMDTQVKVGVA
jgi:hypothetical protein